MRVLDVIGVAINDGEEWDMEHMEYAEDLCFIDYMSLKAEKILFQMRLTQMQFGNGCDKKCSDA